MPYKVMMYPNMTRSFAECRAALAYFSEPGIGIGTADVLLTQTVDEAREREHTWRASGGCVWAGDGSEAHHRERPPSLDLGTVLFILLVLRCVALLLRWARWA